MNPIQTPAHPSAPRPPAGDRRVSPALFVLSTLLVVAITSALMVAFRDGRPARKVDAQNGQYLAEKVGMCWDCHSPRDEKGNIVPERWLQGAALPFTPTIPMPWAPVSKPIAHLPGLTDEQALTFLTTGVLPGGRKPLPPMPEYRFSEADAKDLIAYLRNPVPPKTAP
jgi:mono/diheme cytochrome c family protein